MAAILHEIGTPLQFVALFLLLLAGIARLVVRTPAAAAGRSAAITRLVINRIFIAGLVALVLGTAAGLGGPILDRWVNGDEIVHGAVLSTTGDPVRNAMVDLVSIARVPTNDDGLFDITVPRNRVRRSYELQVTAPGYRMQDQTGISDGDLRDKTVRLTPAPPQLVKYLETNFVVAAWYGLPIVLVTLRVENETGVQASINDLRGTLSGPAGSFQVTPGVWTIANPTGPFMPVTGPFPIDAGARYDLKVILAPGANLNDLYRRVTALPEYAAQAPCWQKPSGSVDPMDDAAFTLVQAFASAHFAWAPGAWHLQLDMTADNQQQALGKDFTLTASEVDGLRNSVGLLKQCLTANQAMPLAEDGATSNFLQK